MPECESNKKKFDLLQYSANKNDNEIFIKSTLYNS